MAKNLACIIVLCTWANIVLAQMANIDPSSTKVDLPFGDLIMATAAYAPDFFSNNLSNQRSNEEYEKILGLPDLIVDDNTFFDLEKKASIILLFGDYIIEDRKGNDIFVFGEGDLSNVKASISVDGKSWINVGYVNASNNSINLKKSSFPSNYYKYLKLVNLSSKSKKEVVPIDAVAISVRSNHLKRYFPIKVDTLFIKNHSPVLKIKDSKIADGDNIEVQVDGMKKRKLSINSIYNKIGLYDLEPGIHQVRITALNRGFIPPNTYRIEIVDGDKIHYKLYRINKGRTVKLYFEIE